MYDEHFSIANIPFGIGSSTAHPQKCVVTRLHDKVIFLDSLKELKESLSLPKELFPALSQPSVNQLAALPKTSYRELRALLQTLLSKPGFSGLYSEEISLVTIHLPLDIRGFTDFSCSKEHCLNAGEAILKKRFLPPGFLHFPIGYSGRPSSIVVSDTPIVRPRGQYRKGDQIIYAPTEQLDYELEIAAVIGKSTKLGDAVSIADADDYIFGLVLLNDWSARDIQGLEMNPLGPMNGKSFATTMSPWIITLEALESFRLPARQKDIPVASYLQDSQEKVVYDIHLQAELVHEGTATTICKSELASMYWSFRDLVAQQTVNGCNLNTGDILATGTISGTTDDSHGCLLELTRGGECAFELSGGEQRVFLQDGDTIRLTAQVGEGIGFGDCSGKILPSK